ncbi:MAG: thiamine biosynthesis protein ThiS [Gloeomargaritaceae cyanobacterium C42_A2020_066]|nr:thiamine biosynthesis protein ThiS [Gloeomargaritaceae cyanobacterium C42_A2020_066]
MNLESQIWVNGEPQSFREGQTLNKLLADLGLNPRLIVVEYNGEIVRRPAWPVTVLGDGDRVEIVTIVGGG